MRFLYSVPGLECAAAGPILWIQSMRLCMIKILTKDIDMQDEMAFAHSKSKTDKVAPSDRWL